MEKGVLLDEEGQLNDRGLTQIEGEFIFQEFAILANTAIARFARDNKINILYRTQKPPEDGRSGEALQAEIVSAIVDRCADARQRIQQWQWQVHATYDVSAGSHFALGLDQYTHATRPLDSAIALTVQRSVKAAIEGSRPPYSPQELVQIARRINNRAALLLEEVVVVMPEPAVESRQVKRPLGVRAAQPRGNAKPPMAPARPKPASLPELASAPAGNPKGKLSDCAASNRWTIEYEGSSRVAHGGAFQSGRLHAKSALPAK